MGSVELPKVYQPQEIEEKWSKFWLEEGLFTPERDPSKEPFVIIMPPPNITGELHMGHALTLALEDALTRRARMLGKAALWLPGEDHAGIAAQTVVEQHLARSGISRRELGREKFLEEMWEWARKYRRIIAKQHKRLGASCDWTRERFTLDEHHSRAVRTAFLRLFEKGLIYKGERIINWCPRCGTALSDLEVEHREIKGSLYYIRYPLCDEEGFITVATTRPETMLGDTAVAVHPDDDRYKSFVGKKVVLPIIGRIIPIIADPAVDPSFGTGAVKITPAHDFADFEIGMKWNLPRVCIMNPDATMNENAGPFAGMDRFECRKELLRRIEREGLLEKEEPYTFSAGHCHRCLTLIEPRISEQWFVRTKPLAEKALKALKEGKIEIIPEHFQKVYVNWLENIRDWCISRQIWWGHRIPVWYCRDCGKMTVAAEDVLRCPGCGSPNVFQDPDVLDTWFSSALWPLSTLGWPDETEDFKYFYPTTVMETGYDILFFWVARMIMMGLEHTGEVPFRKVYLHGLVRDEKGEKMSKTRGNVIDPIAVAEEWGADALRFALVAGTAPGTDIRMSRQKLEGARNFANKIWNAARYIFGALPEDFKLRREELEDPRSRGKLPVEDRWLLDRLQRLIKRVDELFGEFRLGEALSEIHDFFWGGFCDWYIEISKIRRSSETPPYNTLIYALDTFLRLLHPFMPFITEELWQKLRRHLPDPPKSIAIAPYPQFAESLLDPAAVEEMEAVFEIIRAIRNTRAELGIRPEKVIDVLIAPYGIDLARHIEEINVLARARTSLLQEGGISKERMRAISLSRAEVYIPLEGILDLEAERAKLRREIEKAEDELQRVEERLGDEEFLNKAPREVVEKFRKRHEMIKDKLSRLKARYQELL